MSLYGEILSSAHSALVCPVCNRRYALDEISLRGVFDQIVVLQTICSKTHGPIITILLAPLPNAKSHEAVNNEDVLAILELLKNCKKDLRPLWKTRSH